MGYPPYFCLAEDHSAVSRKIQPEKPALLVKQQCIRSIGETFQSFDRALDTKPEKLRIMVRYKIDKLQEPDTAHYRYPVAQLIYALFVFGCEIVSHKIIPHLCR